MSPSRLGMVAPSAMPSDSRRRRPPATLTTMTRLALKAPAAPAGEVRMSGPAAAPAAATPAARRKERRVRAMGACSPGNGTSGVATALLALVLARGDEGAHHGARVHRVAAL